jgi:hypothetical protein
MVYTWIFCLGGVTTNVLNIGRPSGGLCDSPLERGVGVCYMSSLTHPRSPHSDAPPLKRGVMPASIKPTYGHDTVRRTTSNQ